MDIGKDTSVTTRASKTVEELAVRVSTGLSKQGRSPVHSGHQEASPDHAGPTLRLLSARCIKDDQLDLASADLVRATSVEEIERYLTQPGDVLITCRGSILKTCVVPPEVTNSALGASLIAIRPDKSQILPSVLAIYLASTKGQHDLLERSNSSMELLNISAKAVKQVEIPVPDMELQRDLTDLYQKSNQHLRTTIEIAKRTHALAMSLAADKLFSKAGT